MNHQGGSNYTTHYTLDVCVNGSIPNFAIWSSYNNYIDYSYYTGTQVYAINESWAQLQCYRYFIRLNTNYIWVGDPYGSGFDYVEMFVNANTIKFGVSASYGYGLMVRYNDLVYYSPSDYNRLLNEAKQIHTQEDIANGINNLNNSINDSSGPNTSALNNSAGWLPPGPVDSLLNLPLSLLNNINTNLSKSCSPVVLHIPLVDSDLTLPCINTLYQQMGISAWIDTIGAIASALILFSYFMKLYKWVDDTLTLRENTYLDNWGGA